MNINKNNYEAYFLDYHEGNLSPQDVADLFLFLSLHPELKKQFEDFEQIILDNPSTFVFENKDSLKKNITADNREEYFIRAVENTLVPSEQTLLEQFLKKHPQFSAEFQLFQKTKLQADPSLIFRNKSLLKHALLSDDELIAFMEGLLNSEQQQALEQTLRNDPQSQKLLAMYESTRSTADASIVYPNKQELKRKEKKIIPLYYYVASAAASVILLLGMYFLFNVNDQSHQQHFSQQAEQAVQQQSKQTLLPSNNTAITGQSYAAVPNVARPTPAKHTHSVTKTVLSDVSSSVDTISVPVIDQAKEVISLSTENDLASDQTISEKQTAITTGNTIDSTNLRNSTNVPSIAKNEAVPVKTKDFVSVRDLFAGKIKEKFVEKDVADPNKKTDSSTKISGWDIAGVIANKLSNITGKRIEVKPQFNDEGNLKAYALGVGKLEFSRVK